MADPWGAWNQLRQLPGGRRPRDPHTLLPSLLTSTLGAPAAALGAIEGVSDALAGAARFGGGVLADDPTRRRKVAVGGYTTTAVLGAATAAATSVWQVGVLRAAAWTARGLRVPARNALLADIVPANAYGRAYGFERNLRGSAFGLLATVQSLGNLAASAVAGILWTALSPTAAFAYPTAWMVLALAGFAFTARR